MLTIISGGLASGALACSEPTFVPSDLVAGMRVPGKACSVRIFGKRFAEREKSTFVVEQAVDLGGGNVAQYMGESYDCDSGRKAMVVTDCDTAEAAQIEGFVSGYGVETRTDANGETVIRKRGPKAFLEAANDARIDISPANLAVYAVDHAEDFSVTKVDVTVGKRSQVLGRKVDLACACRHFYPGSEGAMK